MGHVDAQLTAVSPSCWAYVQGDGSWGWSNAGLVADHEATLLVDTLFDLALTRRMLDAMADAVPAAAKLDTVVNTHANGDHCWGNQLVGEATVVASRATAHEMKEQPPSALHRVHRIARLVSWLPRPLRRLPAPGGATLGELAAYFDHCFGAFEFGDITARLPDQTFEGSLQLRVGDKTVDLLEVGPAHTLGDTLVHVPEDGVVFTGDLLFSSGHPIVWAGPVSQWILACERIEALAPDVVVPGHGPLATLDAVRRCRTYLAWLVAEVRPRHASGLTPLEAALDLADDAYADWGERERLVANVDALYREWDGTPLGDPTRVFGMMASFHARTR